jgi:GNAT superfamily N-acetyltransferase
VKENGGIRIRSARESDVHAVVAAVVSLLGELRGTEALFPMTEAERVCRSLVAIPDSGSVVVAERGRSDDPDVREIVGVVTASFQSAIRTLGRYALIQELWVEPGHREYGIGEEMLLWAEDAWLQLGIRHVEVGLPSPRFDHFARTSAFYERAGYVVRGPRLYKQLGKAMNG